VAVVIGHDHWRSVSGGWSVAGGQWRWSARNKKKEARGINSILGSSQLCWSVAAVSGGHGAGAGHKKKRMHGVFLVFA